MNPAHGGISVRRRRIALCAVAVLAVIAWRADTQWRQIQARFFDQQLDTARARLAVLEAESADDVRFLEGEVLVALGELSSRAGERDEAERLLLALERKLTAAERAADARTRGKSADSDSADARSAAEGYREQVAIQRQTLEAMEGDVRAARAELAAAREPMERLAERIDALDGFGGWLRGVPVLRAWGAGVDLRSLEPVPEAAAERCVSCHLGMAPGSASSTSTSTSTSTSISTSDAVGSAGGSEGWGRLFAPHPSIELYVDVDSSHPAGAFGCTSCHGGDGLATDFESAGHVPRTEATAERWRRVWRWRGGRAARAPFPIQSGARVESACVACHDAPWLRGAPTQEAGRLLARSMGCEACHDTGRPDLRSSAPSLADLPLRKSRAWAAEFLADPSAWKPTFMPHFWPTDGAERDAEVAAIVAWLWRHGDRGPSEEVETDAPQLDSERVDAGRTRFRQIGCAACHVVDDSLGRGDLLGSQRLWGPVLARIASEVVPGGVEVALAAALDDHDPALWWQKAAEKDDLIAYLSSLRAPPEAVAQSIAAPPIVRDVRDDLLRRRLLEVATYEEADAWMQRTDDAVRDLLLGELAVRRFRCGSCHRLPAAPSSFPDLAPTPRGPSLAIWGEAREPLEPGPSWPHGPSRQVDTASSALPAWRLAPAESEALFVQVAGWRRPPTGIPSPPEIGTPGRDLVARHGCRACHDLDQRALGGASAEGVAAPSLARAGEKLRAEWIFDHLEDPAAASIRTEIPSWEGLRMPRFRLSAEERSQIAEYFAERAGAPVLTPRVAPPTSAERALGAAVYQVLLCDRCHAGAVEIRSDDPEDFGDTETGASDSAPSYQTAGRRLRPDWLRAWLLDAHAWSEDVDMPAPFPLRSGRPDASYLLATLDAPMFDVQRRRLERFYAGRSELTDAFDDPQEVADALAAYVLTLGD